jgi:hypothetical protein
MKRRCAATFIGLVVSLLAGGCNKGATSPSGQSISPGATDTATPTSAASAVSQSDRDAIAEAIQKHLAGNKGINMAAMDMSVDSVTINGDQAQANAAFRLKQGGTGMVMTYFLQRHADGWLVMRSQAGDGQFVHPPMDKAHSGAGANPSGSQGTGMPDVTDFLKNHPAQKSN